MVRVRVTAGNPIRAGQPAVNADAIIADTERRQPLALGMRSCRPVERPAPKSRSFVPFRATSVKFATVTAGKRCFRPWQRLSLLGTWTECGRRRGLSGEPQSRQQVYSGRGSTRRRAMAAPEQRCPRGRFIRPTPRSPRPLDAVSVTGRLAIQA